MTLPCLRFRIERLHGQMRSGTTVYILGRDTRSESRACGGYGEGEDLRVEYGPPRAVIENYDLHQLYRLDLDACVYTATRIGQNRGLKQTPAQ